MASPDHPAAASAPKRQYVNFVFYQVDPAWRRLPEDVRTQGKQEFLRAVEDYTGKVLVVPYSTVGIRGDCDLMLWRISYDLDLFQEQSSKLLASGLGKYLRTPYSYLSMTKRSTCPRRIPARCASTPSFARASSRISTICSSASKRRSSSDRARCSPSSSIRRRPWPSCRWRVQQACSTRSARVSERATASRCTRAIPRKAAWCSTSARRPRSISKTPKSS